METPATLLPDYLKEKKMPAMSEEMKMTFIALQQEQREMDRRTDPDLSTEKDLKSFGEQKCKQGKGKLRKSMSLSDNATTRKGWNFVTQKSSSLPKIPPAMSRTVTLPKMDRVAPQGKMNKVAPLLDRTKKKATPLPKLVSVSPTTESLLLRNKLLDEDIKSMRDQRNYQTRRPSKHPVQLTR